MRSLDDIIISSARREGVWKELRNFQEKRFPDMELMLNSEIEVEEEKYERFKDKTVGTTKFPHNGKDK